MRPVVRPKKTPTPAKKFTVRTISKRLASGQSFMEQWALNMKNRAGVMEALRHPELHGEKVLQAMLHKITCFACMGKTESQLRTLLAYNWQLRENPSYFLWQLASPEFDLQWQGVMDFLVLLWRQARLSKIDRYMLIAQLIEDSLSSQIKGSDVLDQWFQPAQRLAEQIRSVAGGGVMTEISGWPDLCFYDEDSLEIAAIVYVRDTFLAKRQSIYQLDNCLRRLLRLLAGEDRSDVRSAYLLIEYTNRMM